MKLIAQITGDERIEDHAFEIAAHIAQGYLAGRYLRRRETGSIGIAILSASIAYQYAGYLRHREKEGVGDTIKRDIRDYIAGLYIGLLVTKDK